jgi:toxin ParE1/3/4
VRPKHVVLRRAADADIRGAVTFYREEAGLRVARAFVTALEEALGHLSRHPGAGSPRYEAELSLPGLRSWLLRDFPYVIFYREEEALVDVWRILHAHRDIPESLRPNLEG